MVSHDPNPWPQGTAATILAGETVTDLFGLLSAGGSTSHGGQGAASDLPAGWDGLLAEGRGERMCDQVGKVGVSVEFGAVVGLDDLDLERQTVDDVWAMLHDRECHNPSRPERRLDIGMGKSRNCCGAVRGWSPCPGATSGRMESWIQCCTNYPLPTGPFRT